MENHANLAYLLTTFDYFFVCFFEKKFSVNFYILISRNRYKIRRWFCLILTSPWGWAKCKNKPRIKSENLWNRCIILMPAIVWQILNVNPSIYGKRKCWNLLWKSAWNHQGDLLKGIDNKTGWKIGNFNVAPWSLKFLYAPICGVTLRALLLCYNSDDLF